ncbi:MAG: DUF5622 domain-containing protein [Desulfurococcaceae archaeon]
MGLKHGKYIYVKRNDGYYVKVRVLNFRFQKKISQKLDVSDASKYIVLGTKLSAPPLKGIVISEEDLPEGVRKIIYTS